MQKQMGKEIDTSLLDKIIVGRIAPHIYAFKTETIPNYLKVGDTYRPIPIRLREWQLFFPNLQLMYSRSAMLDNGNIFRDYSVHSYLENEKQLHRLTPSDLNEGLYYSKEFFKDATVDDVDEAIDDIVKSETEKNGKYQFYSPHQLPIKLSYNRSQSFQPRKNQQETINRFKEAITNGRTNLLMYAVMRFGKSFTAMCCATEMSAKLVLIVSAKADVKNEWKRTIESHTKFENFIFTDGDDLFRNNNLISQSLSQNKSIAVFLSLQDLQGDFIKDKHKEIFKEVIDLLIIDETHFGARAKEYGKVLQENNLSAFEQKAELKQIENVDDFAENVKLIHAKIRIHLSGTPYRILMGDEFSKEDIIAFYQYSDIIEDKDKWDLENIDKEGINEWDNPYYGFPQMIRFAFNANDSSLKKMEELRSLGVTYSFSALFRTHSLTKTKNDQHKLFNHEKEILDLLEIIDGTKIEENLLGFLNYNKIKDGKMCRHIVIVLPFRASCDALEKLITDHRTEFKNLGNYTIINIAGVDGVNDYKDAEQIKTKIKDCEAKNLRTITLTVNRMLTGSTVPEWDTILYFKDTSSPQEYDQAVFRIQNQYIKSYIDETGHPIRFNMKPQTLLVDFDPERMFRMQELKSQFYNVNVGVNGNSALSNRIDRELEISPIITINHGALKQVETTDVMAVVRQYSQNKSIIDEATDIPFDVLLLNNTTIRNEIEKMNEIDAKKGIDFNPISDDNNDEIEIPELSSIETKYNPTSPTNPHNEKGKDENIEKKLAALYAKILFYSFLTKTKVSSLKEILSSIDQNNDNKRIAQHLGIRPSILNIIQNECNPFVLSKLDYKIQNINSLMNDESLSPLQRAKIATKKFKRISDTEIMAPKELTNSLTNLLPSESINNKTIFLDIASTQGELAWTLFEKFQDISSLKNNIYSISTSPLAYELTKKIYEALGLPSSNIFSSFYTYDIIDKNNSAVLQILKDIKPDIIIGGPPFNSNDAGGRGDSASALYHKYFQVVKENLNPHYIAMYMKAVWYSGGKGKGLDDFRNEMLSDQRISIFHDYPDPSLCGITDLNLRGGICLFLWDAEHTGKCEFFNHLCDNIYSESRFLKTGNENILIRFNKGISILNKVLSISNSFVSENVSQRDPFKLGDCFKSYTAEKEKNSDLKIYDVRKRIGYIRKEQLPPNTLSLSVKWKVLVAKASPGGDEFPHSIISSPIISEPNSVCTNGLLVIRYFDSEKEANFFVHYAQTKFFRFMMLLAKNGHNMTSSTYRYVPLLDFSIFWTDSLLYNYFGISKEEQHFIDLLIRPWHDSTSD